MGLIGGLSLYHTFISFGGEPVKPLYNLLNKPNPQEINLEIPKNLEFKLKTFNPNYSFQTDIDILK